MPEPQGTLTPAQFEIMRAVWDAGGDGASVAEIWKRIAEGRDITRTTVLNQVDRLEERGWLMRRPGEGVLRYTAALDRDAASGRLAGEFVRDFFGGSAGELVQSLLGAGELADADIGRLRKLLDRAARDRRGKGGRP
jgi:predicted transcriptional regulator